MSLVSVLENPNYDFQYPEGFNIVESLVVRHLGAYSSTIDGGGQDLHIGATSNVNIEAAENIQMYVKPTGAVDLYTTEYAGEIRTDTKVLEISAPDSMTTLVTTSNQVLELRGGDSNMTTIVSHTTMLTDVNSSNQFLNIPAGEEFYFGNGLNVANDLNVSGNTIVGRSLLVNDHLITYGNIYGSNLNVWRSIDSNLPENNAISQIGFGFRVNSNHQLELVKYSKFDTKTTAKKVAVFGQAKFTDATTADDGMTYTTIEDILSTNELPEMPNAYGSTVDLTKPIQTYWATAPAGIVYTGGNVGISNNNPEYLLDVNGEARFASMSTDLAVIRQTSTTSDVRLKNVVGIKSPSECFDAINRLRVTRYTFKGVEDAPEFDGFIAQEVEDVFPRAVTENKFSGLDDCKMIDYNQVIANLVGAIQHLSDLVSDMAA